MQEIFNRTELLFGEGGLKNIKDKRVILFGVGGVGSWCAESLVRTGIQHLTIVDSDVVCASNVNRQLMATTKTIGRPKVEALKERLLDINPDAEITAIQKIYSDENHSEFNLGEYDYIIDAIDSLANKASLILRSCDTNAKLFSSMGAALKCDPTKISVAEFWNVRGCPLGAALRKKMKRDKTFPRKKFKCVYSEELLENKGAKTDNDGLSAQDRQLKKVVANGSLAHITGIFGMTIAGLIIQDITTTHNR